MDTLFDHERLAVYQKSIQFISWTTSVLELIPSSKSVHDQLDRASTSIPLNIAEGNGKWTSRDRCRFFDTARGSSLECAAALDLAMAKGYLETTQIMDGKAILAEIVRMLIGLIKANDPNREFGSEKVKQDAEAYLVPVDPVSVEQDQE